MSTSSGSDPVRTSLLKLVSRGNAIIAELLRLSEHIPSPFLQQDKDDIKKYGEVIFDFRYLSTAEACDHRVQSRQDLVEAEEELRLNHLERLERFYLAFESIWKYVTDLKTFIENLSNGIYISHTFETVLGDTDGKQLFSEAIYLYGVMLLVLDARIEGVVRERMVIAYYRGKGGVHDLSNVEDVCRLCRNTNFLAGPVPRRPPNYPEEYFARFPLPREVIQMVVGRLRSDDIYNQLKAYPSPEHRSTALATQAAMLYIMLFFVPETLKAEAATMREICDKYFADNWVLSFYMGFTVDLAQQWEPYKAARAALANTINPANVRMLIQRNQQRLADLSAELRRYLTEGVLVEDYVLDNIPALMQCLRNCNSTLRWLMLHLTTKQKRIGDELAGTFPRKAVLTFFVDTAQFEFVLKTLFQALLAGKRDRWDKLKAQCTDRMTELAEYFGGERNLSRVTKNEELEQWFRRISTEIGSLDYADATSVGRKIQQLVVALEEVEQFHQIEGSIQIKQFLADTRAALTQMIRTVHVQEAVVVNITLIADMSYAWEISTEYIPLMQEIIREKASVVLRLRAAFLKLASVLDFPLVRIMQAQSDDQESVAQYYSSKLVDFVRHVLEIVPVSVFTILNDVIDIQTNKLKELEARISKDQLREVAQLELRGQLAAATHQISVFTEGILAMQTTLLGIIQVDPRQLLEDGVRKELVRQITFAMHNALYFPAHRVQDFEMRLQSLAQRLDGFKRSFEYIQDYISLYGLKIWQEELSRIMNYSIERECNQFLKIKVSDDQSEYQSTAVPIPSYPPQDERDISRNFVGRLTRELLELSQPRRAFYSHYLSAWFDLQQRSELVGIKAVGLVHKAVGVFGLCGVDRLLGFMVATHLNNFVKVYRAEVDRALAPQLADTVRELLPLHGTPPAAVHARIAAAADKRLQRLWPAFLGPPPAAGCSTPSEGPRATGHGGLGGRDARSAGALPPTATDPLTITHHHPRGAAEFVMKIGQCQLLRRLLQNELNFTARLDSGVLACTLENFNASLLKDIRAHYRNPEKRPYPSEENPLLSELAKYLDAAGMGEPFDRIYIATDPLPSLDFVAFLFVQQYALPRLALDPSVGHLLLARQPGKEPIDGIPLVVGMATLLRQFHASQLQGFLEYLGQYLRVATEGQREALAQAMKEGRPAELDGETRALLHFAEDFCRFGHLPRQALDAVIPAFLFDSFRS
ncbi:putative WASH complex subunit 5 [Paratrimastix pyriformis]|uniref:WASH complex subunit 5 n=1 Tax=Paratrimastix pyriformis TaxID=342808 RepID=A0ABQ8UDC0_9EUKA|nr:putative WASH complex subunit 5 [Paratrimastix pyriformis]